MTIVFILIGILVVVVIYAIHTGDIRISDKGEKTTSRKTRWGRKDISQAIAIIIVVGLIAVFIGICGRTVSKTDRSEEGDTIGATLMAKEFIKDRLKSPSTADFPFILQAQHLGNDIYRIKSHVDSENAYGAEVRTHFTIKLKKTGAKKWELLDLEMW